MSQTLDSIHHRLSHERDVAADMAIDMDVDMTDDMDADSLCFHGPVSSDPNIFGLQII
jgi:hypothetical protein